MTRRLNYDNFKPSWPCRCGHVHQRTTLPLCHGSGRWDTKTSRETTVDVEGGKGGRGVDRGRRASIGRTRSDGFTYSFGTNHRPYFVVTIYLSRSGRPGRLPPKVGNGIENEYRRVTGRHCRTSCNTIAILFRADLQTLDSVRDLKASGRFTRVHLGMAYAGTRHLTLLVVLILLLQHFL